MSSFDSQLSALVSEWLARGETREEILRALAYEQEKVAADGRSGE